MILEFEERFGIRLKVKSLKVEFEIEFRSVQLIKVFWN